jgi:hypothetical protein
VVPKREDVIERANGFTGDELLVDEASEGLKVVCSFRGHKGKSPLTRLEYHRLRGGFKGKMEATAAAGWRPLGGERSSYQHLAFRPLPSFSGGVQARTIHILNGAHS